MDVAALRPPAASSCGPHVAATAPRLHGISTSRPRRRRDPPHNVRAARDLLQRGTESSATQSQFRNLSVPFFLNLFLFVQHLLQDATHASAAPPSLSQRSEGSSETYLACDFILNIRVRRRDTFPRTIGVAAAATRLRGLSASGPRRLVSVDYPRRGRGDSSPRTIRVAAAASPP